ncbi:MAG: M1 family metallopeptidase [Bacteroidetes bacterium]|nr:M1 family metallopeptidase [Bacteroidota bacterium]
MKKIFSVINVVVAVLIFTQMASAQSSKLYIPRDILKAYEKGTRSYDGKPGPNYWINHTDYNIQAEVFPKEHKVEGHEFVAFYNESPDTLKQLVIRLYQDIMRKGNIHDFPINPADETDGVKIDTLLIDGVGFDINKRGNTYRTSTNLVLRNIPRLVAPKSSIKLEVKWSVIIPKETRIRMGAYNDSTLYVAYWYPQVAVYDDVDGWDRYDYTGAVEFYDDFNNFNLEITVPKNYLVWGTGLYQNLQDVVKPEIYSRYKEAWESAGVVRIVGEDNLKNGTTLGGDKVVWKLKAEHVPDVSFATSSGYIWDGISAVVDANGRRVLTDAVYPRTQKAFEDVAGYAKGTVETLSKNLPGVPFPYPKITSFNGEQSHGGGMEIPMMCNDGIYPTKAGQAGVTMHEIAHTYFPFYMGINERKYAWMDEGWATFFTSAQLNKLIADADEYTGNIIGVGRLMGREADLPTITPSVIARGGQLLGFTSYMKASVSYSMLKNALGNELFKKCLDEYMSRWNGKHPLPWDFFFTFNDVAKQDLSWFWNPWYFDRGFPDLAVKNVKVKLGKAIVTVEKVGNVPVPIDLIVTYADSTTENVSKNITVWKAGAKEVKVDFKPKKKITKVELNTKTVPDANEKNNVFEMKKK